MYYASAYAERTTSSYNFDLFNIKCTSITYYVYYNEAGYSFQEKHLHTDLCYILICHIV